MKILLAPAETKTSGGNNPSLDRSRLYDFQNTILDKYEIFINQSTIEELSSWFGLKNLDECKKYKRSILELPTLKAIQRYSGVAFEALDYKALNLQAQDYIHKNVYIYSNLFGLLKADENIPEYKFKQGAILPNLNNEKHYKQFIKPIYDEILEDEILDLSASYYKKYYKPTASIITYKFLKNGKVVSHWAKYYRGLLVKQIASNNINNFVSLLAFNFEGLEIHEIIEKNNIKTIVVNITKEGK
jgi:cytoplasmic iron level regulating protein YaaA (DUF328/UPF0246 family)